MSRFGPFLLFHCIVIDWIGRLELLTLLPQMGTKSFGHFGYSIYPLATQHSIFPVATQHMSINVGLLHEEINDYTRQLTTTVTAFSHLLTFVQGRFFKTEE